MIKRYIKTYITKSIKLCYGLAIRFKLAKPSIIVMIDGGICSQMHQYLLGVILKQNGINVEYELEFFKNNGMDLTGTQVRNFDLIKAFPCLQLKETSKIKLLIYKLAFSHFGNYPTDRSTNWTKLKEPQLLLGYYADPENLYYPLFQKIFRLEPSKALDENNLRIYNSIEENTSIAVHVRRGDLAQFVIGYGHPVTLEYFARAISLFHEKMDNAHFYFFSDDPKYVEKELIPSLHLNINYTILNNGSDKGYMDLYLISKCKHQITSKGSLGKYGALLNPQKDKIIVVSEDDEQTFMFNLVPSKIIRL